ncbi:alpha-amylase/4-alpha-glucanotransferase domain-containing protein [Candidatus Sumerlaeota bacterium]
MTSIRFAFGVHNHQPVGNLDEVVQAAYDHAYLPYLELLERHPQFRNTFHCSGALWEWIESHQPDYIDRIARLVESRQLELLTGGFYEPIMPIIPDNDKIGQIRKLTEYLERRFGVTPQGMWLAERVWEPQLAKPLVEAGVKYVIVDDWHLHRAGLVEEQTFGYYLTEDLGHCLALFPISQTVRRAIPFDDVEETIDYVHSVASAGEGRTVFFADDGEKFGAWPGTHEHCHARGWLSRFIASIEENSDWIELLTFGETLERAKPLGSVYLSTSSYSEMAKWPLPAEAIRRYESFVAELEKQRLYEHNRPFVNGGSWRSFLTKYEEANHLHKRMLQVSAKVHKLAPRHRNKRVARARDLLWRGQCGCAYWHGLFGGIYLPHLRHAIFRSLIRAERLLDSVSRRRAKWIEALEGDFNADGLDEVILRTPNQALFFAPHKGGALIEHDFNLAAVNVINTLRRRDEAYHDKVIEANLSDDGADTDAGVNALAISKESGLENHLQYDWHPRVSLIEHFMPVDTLLEDVALNRYEELGDFVLSPFKSQITERKENISIMLSRLGRVEDQEVNVTKTVSVTADIARSPEARSAFSYRVANRSEKTLRAILGIEFNINLDVGRTPEKYYFADNKELAPDHPAAIGEEDAVSVFGVTAQARNVMVKWEFPEPVRFWRYPIETVSLSDAGYERICQSSVLMPVVDLELAPGKELVLRFELIISRIPEE